MSPSSACRSLIAVGCVAFLGCGDNLAVPDAAPDASPDAAIDAANLPDLSLNRERAEIDFAIGERDFPIGSCELDPEEACVSGPGVRRLLHFSVETPNSGDADMILGQPNVDNPAFDYSTCHDHFHFNGYAAYELLDATGGQVAVGRKQAFCLLDSNIFDTDDPTVAEQPRYNCNFQGIQRGWSDVYHSRLPCQFLDITDVADGNYILRVELNRDRGLEESSYDNNITEMPISIGAPALETPIELCPPGADARNVESQNRECGWFSQGTIACTPGNSVSVGCNNDCGAFSLGECTGNPMLRVCDAARPDGNCSYPAALGFADDSCGDACPIAFDMTCPESGMLAVFAAPVRSGEAFTCDLQAIE